MRNPTAGDVCVLAVAILAVDPSDRYGQFLYKMRSLFGIAKVRHISNEQAPRAYKMLSDYAFSNALMIHLPTTSPVERFEEEIAFLRARWRLRMDEDAPKFPPETTS